MTYEVHDRTGRVATFFTKEDAIDRALDLHRNEPEYRPVRVFRTELRLVAKIK